MVPENDRAARDLVDRFWEGILEIEPLIGTEVGDERLDDRLPDPTEEGLARRELLASGAIRDLAGIDRSALDMVLRTSLDLMESIARRELNALEFRFDRFTAVTHLWGPGQLLVEIAAMQRADTDERFERLTGRLSAVPAYLDGIVSVVDEAARVGQTVPRLVADRTIGQLERLLAAPAEQWPVVSMVSGRPEPDRERIIELIRTEVEPAHRRYLDALRRYRPAARETLGLSALPDGEAMYAAEILNWTTLPLSAKQVHEMGLEDMALIQDERREIARGMGFETAEQAIAEYQASGRNAATSREDMVRRAEEQVRRSWDAAPGFFGRLPRSNCEVRPVEEFREADMPFAFYQPPTADNTRPGIYYVNTLDVAERPLHHLASTTFHEASPGHHFQLSIEQEIPDRPPLRRFGGILGGSAFIEGWGLYSERLADEMGLFVDEYERLGMLEAQAWRAARLVVDTGLHAFGWDRERAISTVMEAGAPRLEAEIEVDRYVALAGQALSYKIGQKEIEQWRATASAAEGPEFSLPRFHDRLLSLGSLPLSSLERELGLPA